MNRYQFTVTLKGGAKKPVTAIRRAPGAPWTIKPKVGGKKKFRSLQVTGESKADLELVRARARLILQEMADARFAPPAPPAEEAHERPLETTIGDLIKVYLRDIEIETDIKPATAEDNARRLVTLVKEALQIDDRAAAKTQRLTVLTSALVERWQDAGMRTVQGGTAIERGRERRRLDGMLNKARSLFTPAALNAYRKAKLPLPDLKGFLEAPMKGGWNSATYEPIPEAVVAAMDQAAWGELRKTEPATFATYLMMLRLGMRNSEAEHARRDWIQKGVAVVMQDGKPEQREQAFLAIKARPGWDGPKNRRDRRVPIADDVLEALLATAGEDYLLPLATAQERYEVTHRDVCRFVRRFLPSIGDDEAGRVKAAYELRKHFGAVVASTQSLDRAAEYLGDRRDTVEAHYHAWLQMGTARPLLQAELTPRILAQVA